MEKAGEYGLPHEVRANEERTRLIVKPAWQKRRVSCRRKGTIPRFGFPLPILMPAYSPRGPTMAQACRTTEGGMKKVGRRMVRPAVGSSSTQCVGQVPGRRGA